MKKTLLQYPFRENLNINDVLLVSPYDGVGQINNTTLGLIKDIVLANILDEIVETVAATLQLTGNIYGNKLNLSVSLGNITRSITLTLPAIQGQDTSIFGNNKLIGNNTLIGN
jgi:hypothetical protein